MGTAGFVLALVALILVLQLVIWVPVLIWLRKRNRRATAEMATALQSERVVREPEKAIYRGATAPGYPKVKGNGVMALSEERILFRPYVGTAIDIPLADLTGVREARTFNGAVRGRSVHLIVGTHEGELGFFVADNLAWTTALKLRRTA